MSTLRASRSYVGLWVPVLCAWLLALACFSLPGRDGPDGLGSLDPVALLKVAVRFGTLGLLASSLMLAWQRPERRTVMACLWPFSLFVAWAAFTTLWSALKSVSVGQVLGLIDLFLLAAVVGVFCRTPTDVSRLICHLCCALLLFSAAIVAVDLVAHDLSGLNREDWSEMEGASSGLIHPTTAGATSSLGLVLLVSAWALTDWKWTRKLVLPGAAIYALLLLLAASRMAMVMAAAVVFVLFMLRSTVRGKAVALFAASLIGLAALMADPGLEVAEAVANKAMEKFSRGESSEQMAGLNGRSELWDAIWASYLDSPLRGHGYFVTSRIGEIDVWQQPTNRTAHNAVLQVMVTTGAIGLLLWGVGLAYPLWAAWQSCWRYQRLPKMLGLMLLMVAGWYLGWMQLSESFMGPVQPESVVFFTLLGIAIAHVEPALVCASVRWPAPPGRTAEVPA